MRVLSEVGKVETETFAFFSHLGIKTSVGKKRRKEETVNTKWFICFFP